MVKSLSKVNYEQLIEIHNHYLNVLKSLPKTCLWVKDEYDIEVNRHQLSRAFHLHDLEVQAPNGRPQKRHVDTTFFKHEYGRFAKAMLMLTKRDLVDKQVPRIHKMSAASFVGTEFYEQCCATVGIKDVALLPEGVNEGDFFYWKKIYERNYRYWTYT